MDFPKQEFPRGEVAFSYRMLFLSGVGGRERGERERKRERVRDRETQRDTERVRVSRRKREQTRKRKEARGNANTRGTKPLCLTPGSMTTRELVKSR